jgi:uncharacterized membrane protein YcaP (DUF421 family)
MGDLAQVLFGEGSDLDVLQMALRSAVVFVLALAMIRVSGRRSFGQRRPFDACTTVLLGAVLSRAVVGASPFWPTMAAGAVIVVLHRLVAMASLRWPRFESLVSGDKRELVRDGRRDEAEMRRALITGRDLDEAVRTKVGDEGRPVRRAVLERDGRITVDAPEGLSRDHPSPPPSRPSPTAAPHRPPPAGSA